MLGEHRLQVLRNTGIAENFFGQRVPHRFTLLLPDRQLQQLGEDTPLDLAADVGAQEPPPAPQPCRRLSRPGSCQPVCRQVRDSDGQHHQDVGRCPQQVQTHRFTVHAQRCDKAEGALDERRYPRMSGRDVTANAVIDDTLRGL